MAKKFGGMSSKSGNNFPGMKDIKEEDRYNMMSDLEGISPLNTLNTIKNASTIKKNTNDILSNFNPKGFTNNLFDIGNEIRSNKSLAKKGLTQFDANDREGIKQYVKEYNLSSDDKDLDKLTTKYQNDLKEQQRIAALGPAPDEVFGKDSWEYFKSVHKDTPTFFQGLGYALETPFRVPLANRVISSAAESFGGEGAISHNAPVNLYNKDTGSKILNTVADLGGGMLGLGSTPTGTQGQNLLNFSDDIAEGVAKKVSGGITNPFASKVVGGAVRGAVDNSIGNVVDDIRFNNGNDIVGAAKEGALGGAMFGGVLGGAMQGGKSISDKIAMNKVDKTVNKIVDNNSSKVVETVPTNKVETVPNTNSVDLGAKTDDVLNVNVDKTDIDNGLVVPPGQALNKTKFNSLKNAPTLQTEAAQKVVDDVADFHNIKTDIDSIDIARKNIEEDADSVLNRLLSDNQATKEDIVGGAILSSKYLNDARINGDYSKLRQLASAINVKGTQIGQSLQAFNTWKKLSPEGTVLRTQALTDVSLAEMKAKYPEKYSDMMNKLTEAKKNGDDDLVQQIFKEHKIPFWDDAEMKILTDKAAEIEKMPEGKAKNEAIGLFKRSIQDKIPSTTVEKLLSLQRMNLLLNPKTNVRNVLGNMFMGTLEGIKDIPGAAIDKAISKKTGQRTTYMADKDSLKTFWKGFVDGGSQVTSDFKKGIDTTLSKSKYELGNAKAFKGEGFTNNKTIKALTKPIDKILSKGEDLTSTGLKYGDVPFFNGYYDVKLKQLMKDGNVDVPTDKMKKIAYAHAQDMTFQNNSDLSKAMKSMQRGINSIGSKVGIGNTEFGLGNFIMPFIKTPANIIDKAIDYSPIGGIQGLYKLGKNLKSANLVKEQQDIVNKLSRSLTGSALIGAGMYLHDKGIITGKGSDDYEASHLEQQAGKMPFSLKVGDTYHNLDWIQPAAIPLMIGASISEAQKNNSVRQGIGNTADSIIRGATAGSSTVIDQSLLTGLADLFSGYGNSAGEKVLEGVGKSIANGVTQFVPFNSAMKSVNDVLDPTKRETYDSNFFKNNYNKVISKIPFASQTLPAKVDTLGNEQKKFYGEGPLNWFNATLNPGRSSDFKPSKAQEIALDLYDKTGSTTHMPRMADKKLSYTDADGKAQKYVLNADELTQFQKTTGQAVENAYSSLGSDYYKLTDDEKVKYLQGILSDIQADTKANFLKNNGIVTRDEYMKKNNIKKKRNTKKKKSNSSSNRYNSW